MINNLPVLMIFLRYLNSSGVTTIRSLAGGDIIRLALFFSITGITTSKFTSPPDVFA
jgi:hypothetical protein